MKPVFVILAMLIIAVLEAIALFLGQDGALLAGTIAIIAGLAGYSAGRKNKLG